MRQQYRRERSFKVKKTALVIMAAGLGRRYGGIKQLEPVGPSGEIIIDYSIYDAIEAGFNKIVFIIRKDIENDFKEIIGNRIEKMIEVEYVIQDMNNLPKGYECPAEREKPWGTGHAILSCKGKIKEPFAVINADDYYGKEAFKVMHDFLIHLPEHSKYQYCMAGFILKNTLSENGGVTRGLCQVYDTKQLAEIYETKNIVKNGATAVGDNCLGNNRQISLDSIVSMNMWGFTEDIMEELEAEFIPFLEQYATTDMKAEYLLPEIIGTLIKEKKATIEVLRTNDSWFGVTYKEDKDFVVKSFQKLIDQGVYPKKLFC